MIVVFEIINKIVQRILAALFADDGKAPRTMQVVGHLVANTGDCKVWTGIDGFFDVVICENLRGVTVYVVTKCVCFVVAIRPLE